MGEVQIGFSILIGYQALDPVIVILNLEAENGHEIRKASAEYELQLIRGMLNCSRTKLRKWSS